MPEHVAIGEGENFLNLDPEIHGENLKISVAGDYKPVGDDEKTVRMSGHFVSADGEESGKDVSMIVKIVKAPFWKFGDVRDELSPSKKFYALWSYLKDLGCNVVPNVVVLDENRVAMTDMTAEGGEFFGKVKRNKLSIEALSNKKRELTNLENKFLELDLEKVKNEILGLINFLSDKGIQIQYDDPYDLLVKEDGTCEVVLLDFQDIDKYMYWRDDNKVMMQLEITEKDNLETRVCKEIDDIKKDLLKIKIG